MLKFPNNLSNYCFRTGGTSDANANANTNACANEEILRKFITEEEFNQEYEISFFNTLHISVNKTKRFCKFSHLKNEKDTHRIQTYPFRVRSKHWSTGYAEPEREIYDGPYTIVSVYLVPASHLAGLA